MTKAVLFALMLMCVTTSVSADVIVTVQSGTISSAGTGYVDVYIRSTATDNLAVTSYRLKIEEETTGTTSGLLEFRGDADQSSAQQGVTSPVGYVFLGDTDSANWSATRQDPQTQEIVGGDFTLSGNNVSLTTTDVLLARLQLQHSAATPASAVGDKWVIRLMLDASTYFDDSSSNSLSIDTSSYSNVGTFTVVSAVPEPTVGIGGAAVLAALFGWIRRQRP